MREFIVTLIGLAASGLVGVIFLVLALLLASFVLRVDKFTSTVFLKAVYKGKSLEESAKDNPIPEEMDESSPKHVDHAAGNSATYLIAFIVLLQASICLWYGGVNRVMVSLVCAMVVISFIKAVMSGTKLWEAACFASFFLLEHTIIMTSVE